MSNTPDKLAAAKARNDLAEEKLRGRLLRAKSRAVAGIEKAAGNPLRTSVGPGPNRSQRYDSASQTRFRFGPRAQGGSADSHLASALSPLRRDCQDLERNSSIARIVIRRAGELIVGDGPIVKSTSKASEWNDEADRLFNLWFDALDPELLGHVDIAQRVSGPEMLRGIVSAWCTDGDQLIVRTNRGSLQIIEGERITTPGVWGGSATVKTTPAGGLLFAGVETDSAGAPIRYHVADWTQWGAVAATTRTVAAEFADLVLNPIGIKAGLTRGEPALQAVVRRIERLDSYDEKVAVAAEVATLFSAIVTSKNPAEMQAMFEAGADQPDRENSSQPKVTDMEPGTIQFLAQDGAVHQLKPEFPTTNFRDYVLWHVMVIGAELGLPLVSTMFDASQLSWSNIKALLNMSMRSLEPAQARLSRLVRKWRAWKVRQWIEEGLLSSVDDYDACTIVFPRAPVVDFKSEVDGYVNAINNRLMTRGQAIEALGTGTFDALAMAASEEEKTLTRLGIPAINMPGAGNPAASPAADPASEPADAEDAADATDAEDAKATDANGNPGDKPATATAKAAPKQAAQATDLAAKSAFLIGDKTLAADLTRGVSGKTIPSESATAILTSMVGLSDSEAQAIIGPADAFTPPADPAPAAPTGTTNAV